MCGSKCGVAPAAAGCSVQLPGGAGQAGEAALVLRGCSTAH